MYGRLYPDEYYDSVFELDLDRLRSEGIEGLVIDLDNTILTHDADEAPEPFQTWLREAGLKGFKVCITSNNWATRVRNIASQLDVPLVARATKPLRKAFRQAMEILGTEPSRTAVIGDQIFTDVLGGNLSGLRTILVRPISDHEALHTRILRRVERRILRAYARDGRKGAMAGRSQTTEARSRSDG